MSRIQRLDSSGFWKPSSSQYSNNRSSLQEDQSIVLPQDNESFSSYIFPLNIQRQSLPITKHRKQILYALENYSVVVIVGETGSGKSTQIPQYLYQNGYCDEGFHVVCTQPRRIAAQTLAQRVSTELGSNLGQLCGYRVRFDNITSSETCILFATVDILLREAYLHDPLLTQYSVIMIDEAHELTCSTEILLGIVKKIRTKRKDLKVIICSATIDAPIFLDYFIPPKYQMDHENSTIENKGTIISIDGRLHPVDILYIKEPVSDYVKATVETAFNIHFRRRAQDTSQTQEQPKGDILCFLTTGEEIDLAIQYAEELLPKYTSKSKWHLQQSQLVFLPLYGTLPYHIQSQVFQPKQNSDQRRVIFSTNIAETSVTVPHIQYVIDCGFVKLPYFDDVSGFDRLIVCPISTSSAQQRAGRAGRIGYGQCYRLYKESDMMNQMEQHTLPEILRSNLSSTILILKNMGIHNLLTFDLIHVPPVSTICNGLETLYALGAIDEQTNLTSIGQKMAEFPTEPNVSRMLLESLTNNCAKEVLYVAAAMQVRSLFYTPRTNKQQIDYDESIQDVLDRTSDHVTYVNLFRWNERFKLHKKDCEERFVNYMAFKRACEIEAQLSRFLSRYGHVESKLDIGHHVQRSEDSNDISIAIRKCITAGFFTHTAKLGNDGRYYSLKGGHMVHISPSSVLHKYGMGDRYIIFTETYDGSKGGLEVRGVSVVEGKWLLEIAPHYLE